jgi:hypothetical protein
MFSVPAKRLNLTSSLNEHDALLQEYRKRKTATYNVCSIYIAGTSNNSRLAEHLIKARYQSSKPLHYKLKAPFSFYSYPNDMTTGLQLTSTGFMT